MDFSYDIISEYFHIWIGLFNDLWLFSFEICFDKWNFLVTLFYWIVDVFEDAPRGFYLYFMLCKCMPIIEEDFFCDKEEIY